MKRSLSIVVGLAVGIVLPLAAEEPKSPQEAPAIRWVEMTPEQAALDSGVEMYQALCAVCHGAEGRGDGPAAAARANPCPDLTRLAEANGGDFPAIATLNAILRDRDITAHGSKGMPIWGDIFRLTTNSPADARHRAWILMKHIESIQVR